MLDTWISAGAAQIIADRKFGWFHSRYRLVSTFDTGLCVRPSLQNNGPQGRMVNTGASAHLKLQNHSRPQAMPLRTARSSSSSQFRSFVCSNMDITADSKGGRFNTGSFMHLNSNGIEVRTLHVSICQKNESPWKYSRYRGISIEKNNGGWM